MNRQSDFERFAAIVESKGDAKARSALARGERVILGLRVENNTYAAADDPATRRNESRDATGIYNDRMVVLWRDGEGLGHARVFGRANTEPTAQYDKHAVGRIPHSRKVMGRDADGDGILDAGRLSDGTVEMGRHVYQGAFALRPTQGAVTRGAGRIQRDSNGDGWFTGSDLKGSDDLDRSFLIHRGSRRNTDSAGCQTVHRDDYSEFVRTVKGDGSQVRWQYVLVTVDSTMFKYVQAGRRGGDPVALDPSGRGLHGAHHPQHALFKSILGKVQEEDRRLGRSSDKRSENLGAALTLAAYKAGLRQADEFHFNADGSRAVVVDQPDRAGMARKVTSVDVGEAVNTPIERSEQALQQATPAVGHTALQPHLSPRPAAQPALSR